MFKLIIRNRDGSIYWTACFNSLKEAETWLTEEKKRHYWNPFFTTEIIDNTPPPPTQEELDAQEIRRVKINNLKERVSALGDLNELTAAELKEVVIKLVKFLKLRGDV